MVSVQEDAVKQLESLLSVRGRSLQPLVAGDPDPSNSENVISFMYGLPDADSLPVAEITAATARTMEKEGDWALQYNRAGGAKVLINALAAKLAKDQGIVATTNEILITAGSSQAIDLISNLLLDPGDTVIIEQPTFLGMIEHLKIFGANMVGVPVDEDGMNTDALEETLERLAAEGIRPKMIYVIPNFQNPTGATLSLERRKRIVELAHQYGTFIMEDDAYYDLRFSGETLPPIYTLDDAGTTFYLGTFSKILGGGIRLGWAVTSETVMSRLVSLKTDGCTGVFASYVTADWVPGHLADHIEQLNVVYQGRRDTMLGALEEYMPEEATWTKPDGGFFVWVTLPEGVDSAKLLPIAKLRGVEFLPGHTCLHDGTGRNNLRLSYSFTKDDKIVEGITILADLIREQMDPNR